jgi:hypothetical protein
MVIGAGEGYPRGSGSWDPGRDGPGYDGAARLRDHRGNYDTAADVDVLARGIVAGIDELVTLGPCLRRSGNLERLLTGRR